MTDIQISRALALAIGWKPHQMNGTTGFVAPVLFLCVAPATLTKQAVWRMFDYRMPDCIWPIAERYFAFPCQYVDNYGRCVAWEASVYIEKTSKNVSLVKADTAAKAVAMAVIGSKS